MSGKYRFCPKCGQQLLSNANFCHSCGANLVEEFDEKKEEKPIINEEQEKEVKNDDGLDIPFVAASFNNNQNYVEEESDETVVVENKVTKEPKEEVTYEEEYDEYYDDEDDEDDEDDGKGGLLSKILITIIILLTIALIVMGVIFLVKNKNVKLPFINNEYKTVEPDTPNTIADASLDDPKITKALETFIAENGNDKNKVNSLYIDGDNVFVNTAILPESTDVKAGKYNLNVLSEYKGLEKVVIANVEDLKLPTTMIDSIKYLEIDRCNTDGEFKGIENFTNLEKLSIETIKVTSLDNIAKLNKLTELNLNHNYLTSLSGLENASSLKTVKVKNNNIEDYNISKDIKVIKDEQTEAHNNDTIPNGKVVEIISSNLNARKTPEIADDNIVDYTLKTGDLFDVLEEKQGEKYYWVRIDNDVWIAVGDGLSKIRE